MPRPYTERRANSTGFYPAATLAVLLSVLFISLYSPISLASSASASPRASKSLLKDSPVTLSDSTEDDNKELLPTIARATLKRHFGLEHGDMTLTEFAKSFAVTPAFRKRAGVFVTFSKNGKTRACWGALEPHFDDLVQATVFTTEQALTDEYRFKKITADEISSLQPQITVVTKVEPLPGLSEQNPRLYGMLVRSGGKSGIILAGETTDPYYQLVQCKLKAGITRNEPCQMYRIQANAYH